MIYKRTTNTKEDVALIRSSFSVPQLITKLQTHYNGKLLEERVASTIGNIILITKEVH